MEDSALNRIRLSFIENCLNSHNEKENDVYSKGMLYKRKKPPINYSKIN